MQDDGKASSDSEELLDWSGIGACLPTIPRKMVTNDSNISILKLLLSLDPSFICARVPCSVARNCSYVVNLNVLEDPEDIKCDDMGAWNQSKCATKFYEAAEDSPDGDIEISRVYEDNERTYKVVRRPYINKSSPDLHKTVVLIREPRMTSFSKAFVKYWFKGREHIVDIKAHGNAKSKTIPY